MKPKSEMVDNLTPEQRSALMSRIRGVDTGPERAVRSALHRMGYRFFKHVRGVPGRPDIVFPALRIAVFIDGDFWHGYRFPLWRDSLAPFWREKIKQNRVRDHRNFAKLRREGWTVIRLWEHDVKQSLPECVARVVAAIEDQKAICDDARSIMH